MVLLRHLLLLKPDVLVLLRKLSLLTLDNFAVLRYLLVQLLFKCAHKRIHHLVARLLDFELAAKLP